MKQLVLLLFLLSGACGLVYQVVWTRMMTYVFGTTALAVGTVLAAFMCGLAVGSWLVGRVADRWPNPLRAYAYLELGVAAAALGVHLLLERITPVYLAIWELFGRSDSVLAVARFVLAFGLVMAPTMLMGATLPVLARFVLTRRATVGAHLSTLYAINTIGAVAGALLAGFYLIRTYGIHGAVIAAVVGNVIIGVVGWVASTRSVPKEESPASSKTRGADPTRPATVLYRALLIAFAISGLTSFAYEIYWTRSLVFLLGNSTYAVTTMLTAFLGGIALGGFLVRFVVDRVTDRFGLFGWVQIGIGISSAAALPLLFWLAEPHTIRIFLGGFAEQAGMAFLSRFAVALALMLVPATLIGATFPLVGRIGVRDMAKTSDAVGRIYAANTLGNVLGALLPGLLLLQWLGIQRGILAMAALNGLVGLAVLLLSPGRRSPMRWAAVVVVAIAALFFGRAPLAFQFPAEDQSRFDRVLFYKEGPSVTTKVLLDPDTREKSMSVDGINIGGNGFTDFKQQLLAHLPKLLADDVSKELSIGLGSAILVGESARHGRVRQITCVEIASSVVDGAAFFAQESHGVLRDSRLRVVVDDVANHLRTTSDLYDVISADEKTAQEYAANGFSYSREYYELLLDRLADDGLVAQWVPTDLPPRQYRIVLKTFANSFPHVQLWYFLPALSNGPSNTILVGSSKRIVLDVARIGQRLIAEPGAFVNLERYGLTSAEALLAHYITDGEALRHAVDKAEENTLARPRYEFFSVDDYAIPRAERLATNHDLLASLRQAVTPAWLAEMGADGDNPSRLQHALAAEQGYLTAYRLSLANAPEDEIFSRFDAALALAPWNDSLRARIFLHYWNRASTRFNARRHDDAIRLMQTALSVYDESVLARVEYAIMLLYSGAPEQAVQELETAVSLDSGLVFARRVLADALLQIGRRRDAADQLRALLEIEPGDAAARQLLAGL